MSLDKSRRDQILSAARDDLRRRRREGVAIAVIALLAAGIFYLAVHFSQAAERSTLVQPFIVYFAYFAFWAFLLVLILVLVFLIVRNFVKFVFERRRGVLGSHIRARLTAAFLALTLGPAAVLFLLATFIINTSIERLYEPHLQNVVETSKQTIKTAARMSELSSKVIEAKYDADGEDTVHFAQELSRDILEGGWIGVMAVGTTVWDSDTAAGYEGEVNSLLPPPAERLEGFLEKKRREYNLSLIQVFDTEGRLVLKAGKEGVDYPAAPESDIEKALSGWQGYIPPVSFPGGRVMYAFYPVPRRGSSEEAEIAGAVVVGRHVSWTPDTGAEKLLAADEARAVIQDYETLTRLELPIKYSYFVLLVFVTLIVIFLAIWFGFRMSKGITEPIQLLAEGTEMVASGNLSYRIELPAKGEDEISTLVRSFNKMTEDLAQSRASLNEAYRSLHDTNLELEQRRRYMETVLANVAAGVISLDREKRISTANPAALAMLSETEQSVKGRPLSEVLSGEEMEVVESLFEELENTESQMVQRQMAISRGERTFVVLLTLSILPGEEGPPGMVIVIDDMTDLIKAHRAMAWREVARRIAHEIKNPLTPIQLAAQRLERRCSGELSGENGEVFTECIRTIVHQVDELKHLVNEFSLFAKLPSTRAQPTDLHSIVREVLPLYREAHTQIKFELHPDERMPSLELDREQMKRVLINLLDNAVASIEGDGSVIIETMYNEQVKIARIEIKDTGSGVPPQVRERLFEPYYSTKPGGTGLGLTIVQRIIADHYGYIRVVDNKPTGTNVVIELPVILAERRLEPGEKAWSM